MLAPTSSPSASGPGPLRALKPILAAASLAQLHTACEEALAQLLPCEHFLIAHGAQQEQQIRLSDCLHSAPDAYVQTLTCASRGPALLSQPLLAEQGRPRITLRQQLNAPGERAWRELLRSHDIDNLAWTLLPDASGSGFFAYCFHNVHDLQPAQARLLTALLASHMHIALTRNLRASRRSTDRPLASVPGRPPLSSREIEVVRWVVCGKTNLEISHILHISDKTVKTHVQNILYKLELTNRAQIAARYANHPELAFAAAAG